MGRRMGVERGGRVTGVPEENMSLGRDKLCTANDEAVMGRDGERSNRKGFSDEC